MDEDSSLPGFRRAAVFRRTISLALSEKAPTVKLGPQTINKPLEIGVYFLFAKRRKRGECRIYKYIETLRNKGW